MKVACGLTGRYFWLDRPVIRISAFSNSRSEYLGILGSVMNLKMQLFR